MTYIPPASVFPAGFERISDEPKQIFYDNFDGALDTTNLWTTPTVGNSAVSASTTTGVMSMGTGTVASGWSKLTSTSSFKLTVPAWLGYSFAINLPDGAAPIANSYRFWGAGSIPGVPTTAAPLTDAVGFELSTAGKLYAVVYAGGVRTQIADLSSSGTNKQPLDALSHRYIIYVRTDKTYWYIDGIDDSALAATSKFQSPQVQTLTETFLCIGGATPPASNTQIQCSGCAVWDTGKNATQLADGTYPWRKLQINASGAASVSPTQMLDVNATGNLTALNTTVSIATNGSGTAIMEIGGTWVGTITFEGSNNNFTTLQDITAIYLGGIQTNAATATTNGFFSVVSAGFASVRAKMTAYTSGTANITANSSSAHRIVIPLQGNPNNHQVLASQIDSVGTGTISATDALCPAPAGNGVLLATAPTANSFVAMVIPGGGSQCDVQILGTATGTYYFEASIDSTTGSDGNWIAINYRQSGILNTVLGFSFTTNGIFRGNPSGFKYVRVRNVGGTTPSNAITIRITNGGGTVFQNASVPAGTNKIGTVDIATAAATAKGTQGVNGVPTQDLKDSGRNAVHFYTLIPVITTATDTLQSLTGTKAGATVIATSTPAVVTTGKTLRVTRLSATYIATATSGYGIVRLRFNTGGVVAVTSPIAATLAVGAGTPGTANSTGSVETILGEGWEFAAATGIGISVQGFAAVTATAVGYILVSVTGYEY
jgi:hypothetical protein